MLTQHNCINKQLNDSAESFQIQIINTYITTYYDECSPNKKTALKGAVFI